MRIRLSFALLAFGLVAAIPAHAQYFDYTPRPADVEVDLSVLDDGRDGYAGRQPQTTGLGPVSRKIESAPLPPLNVPMATTNAEGFMPPVSSVPPQPQQTLYRPSAPVMAAPLAAPSPYERSRVVERLEIEDTAPIRKAASPFNPPAIIKPQRPMPESPRTAPAAVVDSTPLSPLDGGDPVIVTGADLDNAVEMPALNVSQAIKSEQPRTAVPHLAKPAQPVKTALPLRKPDTLAHIAISEISATTETPAAPVAIVNNPPEPPAMPKGIRSADSVIKDLYTLPPQSADNVKGEELAALSLTQKETAPPPPPAFNKVDEGTSAGLLIFDGSGTTLDDAMRDTLKDLAKNISKEDGARVLIRAYAAGGDGSKASARNISLSRALAVRSFLMDEGLTTKNIDVRAMGRDTGVSPLDRVDLVRLD